MATIEDILNDSLASVVQDWFEPTLSHPFLDMNIVSVPEATKSIPRRWVDDIQIGDDFFKGDDADLPDEVTSNASAHPGAGWNMEEGQQRLREVLVRLNLPEDRVAHASLDRMGRQELSVEKRRVKQELKRYDAEFRKQYARLPTHAEKEPMRPLYVYYRRLKTMITQVEQGIHPAGGDGMALGFGPRESLATIPDTDELPRSGQRSQTVEEQIAALEARIESLQNEKNAVRAKLQLFQEKFVSENNRKIRFHKDILPIEREYRMYKNLKEDMAKAEQQLRDLRT